MIEENNKYIFYERTGLYKMRDMVIPLKSRTERFNFESLTMLQYIKCIGQST
jgi:hypothetical protein